jgi:hypothetical protein
MSPHWRYLVYVLKHKWFVLVAGLHLGAPLWRLLIHDLSKFRPSEWKPYVDKFYNPALQHAETWDAFARYGVCELAPLGFFAEDRFTVAFLHHCRRNPHHWQYWVKTERPGLTYPLEIPEPILREMVADWAGAGRAITGSWDLRAWWAKNRQGMLLASSQIGHIEALVEAFSRVMAPEEPEARAAA